MFELVNFHTCVEVMYLRICNISLGLMLRVSVSLSPFYRIESSHEETFEMFTEENPDKSKQNGC